MKRRYRALLLVLAPFLLAPTPAGSTPTSHLGSVAHGLPGADLAPAQLDCTRVTQPDRWTHLLHAALRLADQDPSRWTVLDLTQVDDPTEFPAYGRTYLDRRQVDLSPLTPCWALTSVVTHESTHLRQAALGLDLAAYRADPIRYELAADCATYRLVPTGEPRYVPYLVSHRATSGRTAALVAPCR